MATLKSGLENSESGSLQVADVVIVSVDTRGFGLARRLALQGWKLTDETAKIAGYDCKKATCTNKDNKAVIAWYAETIPVSTGPMSFGGLPGMILKVDIENSITVCEAKTIKFKKLGKTDLLKPTKGKKVTEEEFKEEMKKLMQENKGMRIMTGN